MKNKYILLGALFSIMLPINSISQSTVANNNQNPVLQNRFLGFQNNFGVSLRTANITRIWINPNGSNFQGVGTDGYIGMGADPTDVRSRLTLTGTNNTAFTGNGFREWMKTGLFNLENSDHLYIGLKDEGFNRSDAIFAWGDDNAGAPLNNVRFIFTGAASPFGACTNCPTNPLGVEGREVLRMNPNGNVGIGPLFMQNNQPKSLLHLHVENNLSNWIQVSNQAIGPNPNLITPNNGIRLGLLGNANALQNGIGLMYNQENRHLLFSTNANAGQISPTNTQERMRVTAVSAPTALPAGGYGNFNPGNINGTRTRVSISHNPANPVTRPLSLLHLGYNVGSPLLPGSLDGWRDWMDVGLFTAQGTDNMYVGLKEKGNDRFDAVINWGDNQGPSITGPVGPDYLRFIFTSSAASIPPGDPVSGSNDGLEVARMDPSLASTMPNTNYGMVGIGNFSPTGPNAAPALQPDAKLDIDGDLRIRNVENDNSLTQFLAIDPNDLNRVKWVDITLPPPGPGTPLGNLCSDPQSPITGNYEIPLDIFNFYFTDPAGPLNQNENRVVIGQDCNALTPAKLNVYRELTQNAPFDAIGAQVVNVDIGTSNPYLGFGTGVLGESTGDNRANRGVHGIGNEARSNFGGYFETSTVFDGFLAIGNYGVQGVASNGNENIGVNGFAFNGTNNYGLKGEAFGSAGTNYGVYGSASGGALNYAGFFDGDVFRTGTDNFTSDATLKNNIQSIGNAMQIVNQLNPITFEFDQSIHPQIHLANGTQYGFTAQEVEQILPELVKDEVFPPQFDSLGNMVTSQVDFKSLNYQGFIPFLTKGMQEQQSQIDSLENELNQKDSLINDVNDRLTQLENCLSNILPILCQISNSAIQQNNEEAQQQIIHSLNLELFDGDHIVLEQNVPNPFAERTVIKYFLPESVRDAKILFYNNEGRMINEIALTERGNGRINVFGGDLSRGVYSYTLICDGQVIETKKMVKQ
ncbi:MAG: tail fiber domain-containing protein [Crocinitomicaceae bacterium]|nr:tail fiber domain-containing protein [Crocinitomicaceae bacterium]